VYTNTIHPIWNVDSRALTTALRNKFGHKKWSATGGRTIRNIANRAYDIVIVICDKFRRLIKNRVGVEQYIENRGGGKNSRARTENFLQLPH